MYYKSPIFILPHRVAKFTFCIAYSLYMEYTPRVTLLFCYKTIKMCGDVKVFSLHVDSNY